MKNLKDDLLFGLGFGVVVFLIITVWEVQQTLPA